MKHIQSAMCPASPKPPRGTGNDRTALACLGFDSCSCRSGVMIAPGDNAFRRTPDPAHPGSTACRRTQRLTAILDAPYIIVGAAGPNSRTARTALSASWASSALTARRGTAGIVVVELLATTTTFAPSAVASAARQAASNSTTPK